MVFLSPSIPEFFPLPLFPEIWRNFNWEKQLQALLGCWKNFQLFFWDSAFPDFWEIQKKKPNWAKTREFNLEKGILCRGQGWNSIPNLWIGIYSQDLGILKAQGGAFSLEKIWDQQENSSFFPIPKAWGELWLREGHPRKSWNSSFPKKMGISPRGIPAGNPIRDFLIPLSPRIPSLSWQFPAGSNLGIHLDIPTWKSSSGGSGNPWKIPGFFSLPEGIRKLFHGFVLFCFFSQVFDALLFSFFPPGCCWWISWSFPGIFLEFSWNSLRAGWPGWWWGRSGPGTGLGGVHPST